MHQTFYIDVDEEISSVIDRLRKSMAADNYFVVPKRAIFLQSIVNLKLLKRESEKIGKHAILVTQDEIGASMAKRSGIDVMESVDGIGSIPDVYSANDIENDDYENVSPLQSQKVIEQEYQDKKKRLSSVGSDEFYDQGSLAPRESAASINVVKNTARRIPVNSIADNQKDTKREKYQEKTSSQPSGKTLVRGNNEIHKPVLSPGANRSSLNRSFDKKIDPSKEKTLEKMFSSVQGDIAQKQLPTKTRGEKKIWKLLVGFVAVSLVVFAGVAAYLFIPSARINIVPNIQKKKIDVNIHGKDSLQIDSSTIPVRVIDREDSVSLSYDVTGKGALSGKKAHGSVVIYNEFSSSSQTLIATTRLESADGKIFRIVKSVVVPGTTMVSGEVKPGAIEAEVVADQPGSEFNVDATTFMIPGFKGSPKFDKFYAKSSVAMTGGSSDDSSATISVSQSDIDNARQKTEAAIKDKLAEAISRELKDGEQALVQAQKITITKTVTAAKAGDVDSSFEYTVSASMRVLVFSENDVRKIIEDSLKDDQDHKDSKEEIIKVEYGSVEPDFDNNSLELKIHSEIKMTPNIDLEQIKKELLGKDSDELKAVLKKYPSVKSINMELKPPFVSHIPQYSQRVVVEISQEG